MGFGGDPQPEAFVQIGMLLDEFSDLNALYMCRTPSFSKR